MDWDRYEYNPGSFSKNFSWGPRQQGLKKLHEAINLGFNGKLKAIKRDEFRKNVEDKIDGSVLIPLNFFLFNKKINGSDHVLVDELISQALNFPHSLEFDRLAAFCLTLSKTGSWKGSRSYQRYPAVWAKKLISTEIYDGETWNSQKLNSDFIEQFLKKNLVYKADSPRKFATNLNYIFVQANYDRMKTGILEDWWTSALFLTFDRYLLDLNKPELKNTAQALEILKDELFYSLTAVPMKTGQIAAKDAIKDYLDEGQLGRFSSKYSSRLSINKSTNKPTSKKSTTAPPKPITRVYVSSQRQVRDRKLVSYLKNLYQDHCIICDNQLCVSPDGKTYSEAGHVKPVGKPFSGPDHESNVFIFCPNHHKVFDRGGVRINTKKSSPVISMLIGEKALNGKTISIHKDHNFDLEFAEWHFNYFQPLYD